jgi:hypothetical protein
MANPPQLAGMRECESRKKGTLGVRREKGNQTPDSQQHCRVPDIHPAGGRRWHRTKYVIREEDPGRACSGLGRGRGINMTDKIDVQGKEITIISRERQDYISLTDIAKYRNSAAPADIA